MQLNLVNSCSPGAEEQAELAAALGRISSRPAFSPDFEVARGRTTAPEGVIDWVRVRREFRLSGSESGTMAGTAGGPEFINVQFLFSAGERGIDQVLVFHTRASRPGEPLQVSLEHQAGAATTASAGGGAGPETAAQALAAEARPNRIRLERFGKGSVVLARCAQADQSRYEPLFHLAAERFASYRAALRVRSTVMTELGALGKTR